MNEEIKEILEDVKKHLDYVEATKQSSIRDNEMKAMYNYITNLQKENQKLNKIIDELEKWLKETKKFNYGFKIKSEYIYVYEFVCKNILNKLSELKKRWNK